MKKPIFILVLFSICGLLEASSFESPDPANLSTGWWEVFADKEENKDHLEKLIAGLKDFEKQMTGKAAPVLKVDINQLIFAVQNAQKMRRRQLEYQPIYPLYLNAYTIANWLDLMSRIRTLEKERAALLENNKRTELSLTKMRNDLDRLQLEYATLQAQTVEKLKAGLDIMTLRFNIDAATHTLTLNQKKLAMMDDNLSQLSDEKQVAGRNLDLSTLDPAAINREIEQTDALLTKLNEELLNAEKQSTGSLDDRLSIGIVRVNILQAQESLALQRVKLLFAKLDENGNKEKITSQLSKISSAVNRIEDQVMDIQPILRSVTVNIGQAEEKTLPKIKTVSDRLGDLQGSLSDLKLLMGHLQEKVVLKKPTSEQIVSRIWLETNNVLTRIWGISSIRLFRINDYPVTLWVLIRAFLVFIGFIVASKYLIFGIKKWKPLKRKIGSANLYIITTVLFYAMITLGFVAASVSMGFSATNFVILGGALGVGVGLGLQSIVNNFFSGLVVLFTKILKVGDIVETDAGYLGKVRAINMQNIHIRTFDGKDVVIPNAELVNKFVVNWTMVDPYVRLHIPFGIQYGANKDEVEKIILEVAESIPHTINNENICPKPKVWLTEFADSALNIELVVWVNFQDSTSRGSITAEYLWEIEKGLKQNGISIPFPQRDLHIKDFPESLLQKNSNN